MSEARGTRSGATRALIALVAGLAVGLALEAASQRAAATAVAIASPIGTLWVAALRMTVVPLVVSLLIATIAGSGETRRLGALGARTLASCLALLLGTAAITFVLAPLAFRGLVIDDAALAVLRREPATVAAAVPSLADWVLALVPANPIRAAVDGAMLPLIVFTVAFAAALARAPEAARLQATRFFRVVADAMLIVVGWVLAIAPLGVFALALALAARLGSAAVGAVGWFIAAHSALLIVPIVLLYPVASIVGRRRLGRVARAFAPPQLVGGTARSSVAALPAMLDALERALGVPAATVGVALPLAAATFRLNQAVSWGASSIFIAALYGVPFGAAELATMLLIGVAMNFAVPGIPSGGVFVMLPFLAVVGLPAEGIGVVLAADSIPDIFKTMLNVTGQMTATLMVARREAEA